jgi:CRP-like cAMP-binding protein
MRQRDSLVSFPGREFEMLVHGHGVACAEDLLREGWPGAARSPGRSAARSGDLRNGLLRALPAETLEALRPLLQRVELRKRQVLHERNTPVACGYFIEHGTASLQSRVDGRSGLEVGTLGRRDFVGLPLLLGTGRTPHRCVVQVPGEAYRIGAADLQDAMEELPSLRQLLFAYVQAVLVQSSQLVVCSTRHSVQERLTRWLLSAHDRIEGDAIPVTHQALSRSLGVRRAGITTTLGCLEKAGLIRRGRGCIRVLDPESLQDEACDCYHTIRAEYRRLAEPTHAATT